MTVSGGNSQAAFEIPSMPPSSAYMTGPEPTPIVRLLRLISGALRPPRGLRRIAVALAFGAVCHAIFGLAVVAMIVAMFFGMSESLGTVPAPLSYLVNALLLIQFPLAHSILLTTRGGKWLLKLAPREHALTLMTTCMSLISGVHKQNLTYGSKNS